MNNEKTGSVFNRSGLAALSELQTEEWQNVFSLLEDRQTEFLAAASEFRSGEYIWPNDPLHCWSRIWEYPYVYYHIAQYVKGLVEGSQPVVADVGSGVTFFPFSLAKLGCEVICTDIDPVCEKDIVQARECIPCSLGDVNFRLIKNESLPFDDCECDVIYNISVLEHIPNFESTVKEIARILKPGGLCLITCDLGLDPVASTQLNAGEYERLISVIGQHFNLLYPDSTIHPVDVLTNRNSPYPDSRNSCVQIFGQVIKQKIIKPLLGREPGYTNLLGQTPLAVLGLVLQKQK